MNAPSAASIGTLAHTFAPGDVQGLARAIERARAAERDPVASAELAESFAWDSAIASELADVGRLLERLTR